MLVACKLHRKSNYQIFLQTKQKEFKGLFIIIYVAKATVHMSANLPKNQSLCY